MERYRVEVISWDGKQHGAEHLAEALNRFAAEGWEPVSVVPTRAGATGKLLSMTPSADTTELAIVLRRATP